MNALLRAEGRKIPSPPAPLPHQKGRGEAKQAIAPSSGLSPLEWGEVKMRVSCCLSANWSNAPDRNVWPPLPDKNVWAPVLGRNVWLPDLAHDRVEIDGVRGRKERRLVPGKITVRNVSQADWTNCCP